MPTFLTGYSNVNLDPVYPPIGAINHLRAQKPQVLLIKEKMISWTGDDFDIWNQDNEFILKCDAKLATIRGRKDFYDSEGNKVFTLAKQLIALRRTFYAEDGNGDEIFKITKNHINLAGSRMRLRFTNADTGLEMILKLNGDWFARTADIVIEGGPVVAQIRRDLLNFGHLVADRDTYLVSVAPGVDMGLIIAFCICFDETSND